MELRCNGKLHGILVAENVIEVKCKSVHCGAGRGIVVLHRYDTLTGNLVSTQKFRDPERSTNAAADRTAVRTA